jgi:starch phosphorylase
MAKLIIKLINSVAATINQDPVVSQVLKVVFLPDFNVKNGQHVYPAADLSDRSPRRAKRPRAPEA